MITNEQHEREQAEAEEQAIEQACRNICRRNDIELWAFRLGIALCLALAVSSVFAAEKTSVSADTWELYRSGSPMGKFASFDACDARRQWQRACDSEATPATDCTNVLHKTSGTTRYVCRNEKSITVVYQRDPVTPSCPSFDNLLRTRSQTCPSGTLGTWTQTATFVQSPPPDCTVSATWAPTEPPAGSCVSATCPTPPDRARACPDGYSGDWRERATVTGTPPNCVTTWTPINPMSEACTPSSQGRLFFDDFEYDVSRAASNVQTLFTKYPNVKAENAAQRSGSGYLYTRTDATRGSRVLVLESIPSLRGRLGPGFEGGQTDYYLQIGREGRQDRVIPANAWIQFWTYATGDSQFATRDKTIYPCRGVHPCHPLWLFMWGARGFEEAPAPQGGRFLALEALGATRDSRHRGDGNEQKLNQNVARIPLVRGRWYQVRLHIDISGSQGLYEAWIREQGQSAWTQVANWRGGQTPYFSWPITVEQDQRWFNLVRIPTTVNGPTSSTTYLDDFAITETQGALP